MKKPPLTYKFLSKKKVTAQIIDLYYIFLEKLRKKINPHIVPASNHKEIYLKIKIKGKYEKIYIQKFMPDNLKGIVICQHGNSVHSDLFFLLADSLFDKDIGVIAIDNRGHGRSDPPAGDLWDPEYIFPFYDYFMKKYQCPKFLLGESLGSTLVAYYLASREGKSFLDSLKGVIFQVSPYKLKIEERIPLRNSFFGHLLVKVLYFFLLLVNTISFGKKFIPNTQITDKRYYRLFSYGVDKIDPIRPEYTTARHFSTVIFLIFRFRRWLSKLKHPVLILEGTDDSIVSPGGAYNMAISQIQNQNKVKLIMYKGADHSLYNDKNAKRIFFDIHSWILRLLD